MLTRLFLSIISNPNKRHKVFNTTDFQQALCYATTSQAASYALNCAGTKPTALNAE
jgi:hypothetical protein